MSPGSRVNTQRIIRMITWAIYKNEERELREFVNKEEHEQQIATENNGSLVGNINHVEIRYRPDSKKLLFTGERNEVTQPSRKFIKFIEQDQRNERETIDIELKTRRH